MELRSVSLKALALFRRRARRRLPNEYIEAIWGRENTDGSVSIVEFRSIDYEADADGLDFNTEDVRFGERDGDLIRLGSIHSHPNSEDDWDDCVPSEQDWMDAHLSEEYITGILVIPARRKGEPVRRSHARFYYAKALCQPRMS